MSASTYYDKLLGALVESREDANIRRELTALISALSVTGWPELQESATAILQHVKLQSLFNTHPPLRGALQRATSRAASAPQLSAQRRAASEVMTLMEQLERLVIDLELQAQTSSKAQLGALQDQLWLGALRSLMQRAQAHQDHALTALLAELSSTLSEQLLINPQRFFDEASELIAEGVKRCGLGGAHLEVADEQSVLPRGGLHDLRGVTQLSVGGWALAGLYGEEPPLGRDELESIEVLEPALSCWSEEALLNLASTEALWALAEQYKPCPAQRSFPSEHFIACLKERHPKVTELKKRALALQLIADRCLVYRKRYEVRGVAFRMLCCPKSPNLEPFWVMETQVTQALWQAVMGSNPSEFEGPKRPVESVSWEDCVRFANALSRQLGLTPAFEGSDNDAELREGASGFRLPFEAEWRWAARGGQRFDYAGSPDLSEVGWYSRNAEEETHEVAQLKPNGYGVYDMSGNVYEWCLDEPDGFGGYVPSAEERVYCGGSWESGLLNCLIENSEADEPDASSDSLGLRLFCSFSPSP